MTFAFEKGHRVTGNLNFFAPSFAKFTISPHRFVAVVGFFFFLFVCFVLFVCLFRLFVLFVLVLHNLRKGHDLTSMIVFRKSIKIINDDDDDDDNDDDDDDDDDEPPVHSRSQSTMLPKYLRCTIV